MNATMTTVGLGTNVFTYTDAGRVASESGLWANDRVSYGYHGSVPGLRTSLTNQQPSGNWVQSYGYDAAARVQSVTSPAGTFTYRYKGPGTLWTNLALPTGGAITNGFDTGGRLTATRLRHSSGTVLNQHDYLYNSYGQRQRHTRTDSSYTTYGYDNNAQLTSALGYTAGGTPIGTEQLGFGYDAGWNLTNRSVNGVGTMYGVDDRNQLSAVGAVSYVYDANGNLRSEGGGVPRNFTYDEENRLVTVNSGTSYRSDFAYDGLSRLRVRTDSTWNGSSWVASAVTRYLYDGMLVVQERDGSNNPLVAYTRGKDLSGSLEGAGGIGGLLARTHGYSGGTWSTHSYYYADRLGNITSLLNASNVKVAAYKYDAYGRNLGTSGSLATANVYRFSSKMIHPNSGLYYYGYRFYDPSLQRWLNRDPIEEEGGINLYNYVANAPVVNVDKDGLSIFGGMPPGGISGPFNTWWSRHGGGIGALLGTLGNTIGNHISAGCGAQCKRGPCESCCRKGFVVSLAGIGLGTAAGTIGTGGWGIGIAVLSGAANLLAATETYNSCMAGCANKPE